MSVIAITTPTAGYKRCSGSDVQLTWDEGDLGPTNRRCSACGEWVPTSQSFRSRNLAVRHYIKEVSA